MMRASDYDGEDGAVVIPSVAMTAVFLDDGAIIIEQDGILRQDTEPARVHIPIAYLDAFIDRLVHLKKEATEPAPTQGIMTTFKPRGK